MRPRTTKQVPKLYFFLLSCIDIYNRLPLNIIREKSKLLIEKIFQTFYSLSLLPSLLRVYNHGVSHTILFRIFSYPNLSKIKYCMRGIPKVVKTSVKVTIVLLSQICIKWFTYVSSFHIHSTFSFCINSIANMLWIVSTYR